MYKVVDSDSLFMAEKICLKSFLNFKLSMFEHMQKSSGVLWNDIGQQSANNYKIVHPLSNVFPFAAYKSLLIAPAWYKASKSTRLRLFYGEKNLFMPEPESIYKS